MCLVATYPWREIREDAAGQPPGAIVCSDTRLTRLSRPPAPMEGAYAKQYLVGPTLYVCFTSSNVSATAHALSHRKAMRGLKFLGERLQLVHEERGGLTQLLAVTFKAPKAPRVYALTPPAYTPVRRFGVIGIGAPRVLEWVRENRAPVPREPEELTLYREQLRAANPNNFIAQPAKHGLQNAAMRLAAVLQEAIREVHDATVALPLHVSTFSHGEREEMEIAMSNEDVTRWQAITVRRSELRRLDPEFHRAPVDDRVLPPIQVID